MQVSVILFYEGIERSKERLTALLHVLTGTAHVRLLSTNNLFPNFTCNLPTSDSRSSRSRNTFMTYLLLPPLPLELLRVGTIDAFDPLLRKANANTEAVNEYDHATSNLDKLY